MVRHAKVPLDEVLNHWRVPASRGLSHVLWARFAPRGKLLALGCGAFAGSPWRRVVYQAGHALAERRMAVITHGVRTESAHRSHVADALALSQGQESMETFDQFQSPPGLGLLETTIELLAGEGAQV